MQQYPIFLAIKCDIPGCKQHAKHMFSKADKKQGISLCAACEKQLYELVSKQLVPPALSNPFRQPKPIKKEQKI